MKEEIVKMKQLLKSRYENIKELQDEVQENKNEIKYLEHKLED